MAYNGFRGVLGFLPPSLSAESMTHGWPERSSAQWMRTRQFYRVAFSRNIGGGQVHALLRSITATLHQPTSRSLPSVIFLSHIEALDIGHQRLVILCAVKFFTPGRGDVHCKVLRAGSPPQSVDIPAYIEVSTFDYQRYELLCVHINGMGQVWVSWISIVCISASGFFSLVLKIKIEKSVRTCTLCPFCGSRPSHCPPM